MNRTKYETYTSSHGVENQCAIYEGPLQILISRNTMSAAEDFTAMFKGNKRGTLIGEPTYGSTGTPCMISLRCGGRAQVVSVGYRLLDGTEFIGKGIMPDVAMDAASI
jgi:C-terminal processing protease CtpA/Prc